MPASADFQQRLETRLNAIVAHFGTPFHIYDEKGIKLTCNELNRAFSGIPGFREFFAVKALPNPSVMQILRTQGFGFDCSSIPELKLSRRLGASGGDIMFTSANTSQEEYMEALGEEGCLLNLDDISFVAKVPKMPELICFRYNPGSRRTGNSIIGNPVEAKYGVAHDQILEAYRRAIARGAARFGLHSMLASNERKYSYMVETARMLLELAEWISAELSIQFEFINIGGGLGIPYRPEENRLDIQSMAREITALFDAFKERHGYAPKMYMESGRYITGPHGILVTRAINRKEIYRNYVGVDACMSALMRPGMYGAYHHITVAGKSGAEEIVDVMGSLCENNDKFAIQRSLPATQDGDILLIHDTGAHGIAMGFNYNGKLRPKELLLREDGAVELIRREERVEDYFATLEFEPDRLELG